MLRNQLGLFIFAIFSVIYASANTNSENYKCSDWSLQSGLSCVVAGHNAGLYARQCENPCWKNPNGTGNWGPNCDKERICSLQHPNQFAGTCSQWIAERSITCYNPSTNRWEQKWVRSCTVGLVEDWCSDMDPN